MKLNTALAVTGCFLGAGLLLGGMAAAQNDREFPQPTPEKQVTVTAIPGVIAAGAQWKLIWQGPDNADGIVATPDGGLLFAQEQPSTVGKLDANDKFSIFARGTHGTGALGFDSKGRLIGVERTCSDPGGNPEQCHEAAQLIVITPTGIQPLASEYNGKTFWRMGELVCDSKGGVYFSDDNGTYFMNAAGKVSLVADRKTVRTNGMMLSRDEKTLYLTNGGTVVAFDVRPDGTTANQREFAKLQGGNGDGMAIDAEGRLYVTAGNAGIQVFSTEGKYLGTIPLPRSASSVAFGGPGKKVLYGKGAGMIGPDGKEYRTAPGERNNAKAIYKIDMIAQGFTGRAK
jgi:sugar lactone lactonase YvrE